jgi:hypothetical protein
MINWIQFLKDIFKVSLSSFGGPEAHYGIFSRYLVEKKKYLSEEELLQLIALHSIDIFSCPHYIVPAVSASPGSGNNMVNTSFMRLQ